MADNDTKQIESDEEFENIEGIETKEHEEKTKESEEEDEVLDDPDGLFKKKKKKKKNKVSPESDVVTSTDEKKMALKKVFELEKQLLDTSQEKKESEEQITGLKYEVGGLEKNLKELRDTSEKSLEDLEKFEVKRLKDEVALLQSENAKLKKKIEDNATEKTSIEKERELLQSKLETKKEEMKSANVEVTQLKKQLKDLLESNKATLETLDSTKTSLKDFVDSTKQKEEALKTLLDAEKGKWNLEKDQLLKQLKEEQSKLQTSENEMGILKNEIEKLLKEKEEEKAFRMKIAERLKMLIDDKTKMEASYKLELGQVSNDFEDLKKHLIHITSDKVEMFQKLSDIVFEKSKKQRWVSDVETTNCTNCREKFSFTVRKHHCRLCGHIFCFQCSDRWLLTPQSSKRVRSCDVCADSYCSYHTDVENGLDSVDAASDEYRELKGDELKQYDIEEEEEEEGGKDGNEDGDGDSKKKSEVKSKEQKAN